MKENLSVAVRQHEARSCQALLQEPQWDLKIVSVILLLSFPKYHLSITKVSFLQSVSSEMEKNCCV